MSAIQVLMWDIALNAAERAPNGELWEGVWLIVEGETYLIENKHVDRQCSFIVLCIVV